MLTVVGGAPIAGQLWAGGGSPPASPELGDVVAYDGEGPYVRLFEVTQDGTALVRLCDWVNMEPDAVARDNVTFDSKTYTTAGVAINPIVSDIEGGLPTLEIAISDPGRVFYNLMKAHDPSTVECRIVIIPFATVSDATTKLIDTTKVFRKFSSADSPPSLTGVLGAPPIFELKIPRVQLSRKLCPAAYTLRYDDHPSSMCTYPSRRFGFQTRQIIASAEVAGPASRTDTGFGWSCENMDDSTARCIAGTRVPESYPGMDKRVGVLSFTGTYGLCRHDGTNNEAPIISRLVDSDENGGIDVYTKTWRNFADKGAKKKDTFWGLFIESGHDATDQVLLFVKAVGEPEAGLFKLYYRKIDNGVAAADVEMTWLNNHNSFRANYDGDGTWTFYTRDEDPNKKTYEIQEASGWTTAGNLFYTPGTPAGGIPSYRCGWICGSDDAVETKDVAAYCWGVHFLSGGLTSCSRVLNGTNGCEVHDNGHQFQGTPLAPAKE